MPCPWYVRQVTRLNTPNLDLRKAKAANSRPKKMPRDFIYHADQPNVVSGLWA
jgi:hypothetical protein